MFTRTLLAALAVCAVTAISASAASAAIKYEWMVNKSPLAGGKTDAISAKIPSGKKFVLKFTLSGASVEVDAGALKLSPGADIIGGKAGSGEGTITFEKLTVAHPEGCEVEGGQDTTENLTYTVVEGASGGVGDGKALILIAPKKGERITTLKFHSIKGENCQDTEQWNLTGALLAEGVQSEVSPQTWTLAGANEYIPYGGKATKAEAKMSGGKATLTGAAQVELASGELFAAL
jgi:hypothetical protein